MDIVTYALCKKYVNKTLAGSGALNGAPATIKSITKDGTKHIVTFEWTDNDGNTQISEMTIDLAQDIAISEEEGNLLELKTDGLYLGNESAAISPKITDETTGSVYEIKIDNGNVYIEESDDTIGASGITIVDQSDSTKVYTLKVNNAELYLEEA